MNNKLKKLQNRTRKSKLESESEKGEIDEESEFEMESRDTPTSTNIEEELNLHTDGEINTAENKNSYFNTSVRTLNRKYIQTNRYGRVPYIKNIWT